MARKDFGPLHLPFFDFEYSPLTFFREVSRKITNGFSLPAFTLVQFSALLLFSLILVAPVYGDEDDDEMYPQAMQEVFQSDLVFPQEKDELQFTLAPRWRSTAGRETVQVPVEVEYGITNALQVEFEGDLFLSRMPDTGASTYGPGDVELGFTYAFMNIEEMFFHVAVGGGIGFPSGDIDKELGEGFMEYETFVTVAKDFPEWNYTQIFLQVSLGFVDRLKTPADPDDLEPEAHELGLNAGFFIPVDRWRLTMEFNWENNEWNNGGTENEMFLTPGLVYSFPEMWEVGIGVPVGLNNQSEDVRVIAQVVVEFDT